MLLVYELLNYLRCYLKYRRVVLKVQARMQNDTNEKIENKRPSFERTKFCSAAFARKFRAFSKSACEPVTVRSRILMSSCAAIALIQLKMRKKKIKSQSKNRRISMEQLFCLCVLKNVLFYFFILFSSKSKTRMLFFLLSKKSSRRRRIVFPC